jgi:uncharacterized protein YbbC (DUF1343 family)
LPWTNPSPNMRTLPAAILYPGLGLLESALSVGRGTDRPFEIVGAPYVDDVKLAEVLNSAELPGVRFLPIQFTPSSSIHQGKLCKGVFVLLTDRDHCNVVDVGLLIAKSLCRLYAKDFNASKLEYLLLHPATLEAIKADKPIAEIRALWQKDLDEFMERRAKYLLY